MNPRERIFAVFNDKSPDKVPWFADLSWWYGAADQFGKLDEKYRGDGYVQLHRDLDCGVYLPPLAPYKHKFNCRLEEEKYNDVSVKTFFTPFGELREVMKILSDSHTMAHTERMVKSKDDLRALKYLFESQEFVENHSEISRWNRLYGSQGVPILCLPRTPLSRMFVEFAGVETTIFLIYEMPDLFEEIIEILRRTDSPAYEIVCQSECEFVMFPDNLSSEIVSPQLFSNYSLNYYKQRNEELHKNNKFTMTHIDGTLRGLLPILAESGLDCVEGLTPYPVGDVKPEDLRKLTGNDLILWGGIPGSLFSPDYPEDDFIEYVTQYIEVHKTNFKFVLGVGDQVPPNGVIERVKLISEIVDEIGKY